MKKIGSIMVVFLMAIGLTACGQSDRTRHNDSDLDSGPAKKETANVTEKETENMAQEESGNDAADISFDFETRSVTLNSEV